MRLLFLSVSLLIFSFAQAQQTLHIIPQPVSVQQHDGSFLLDEKVAIQAPANNKAVAVIVQYFSNAVTQVSGYHLATTSSKGKQFALLLGRQLKWVMKDINYP
jgi:hexosaminidase